MPGLTSSLMADMITIRPALVLPGVTLVVSPLIALMVRIVDVLVAFSSAAHLYYF